MNLKLFATTVVAVAALGGAAAAQDAANSWTGFYAGVNLGGAWNTSCASVQLTSPDGTATSTAASNCSHPGHFIGGGQIGYNYEISNFVVGLEGGISGGTQSTQNYSLTTAGNATIPAGVYTLSGVHTPGAIGEIRARLGYDIGGKALIYATGGGIFASTSGNAVLTYVSPDTLRTATFTSNGASGTRTGWMLGGGVEYKLTPNWSVKAEDLFANTGNLRAPTICADGSSGAVCNGFTHVTFKSIGNAGNVNIFRVGLNYRFF